MTDHIKTHKKAIIAVVAAKSGGHIIPGLTLAQQYRQRYPQATTCLFTTNHNFDKKISSSHNAADHVIYLPLQMPAHYYQYPKLAWQLIYAVFATLYRLVRARPKRIIVMGGYVSIPVSVAAFLLVIPIDLYELNAIPGKATRLLAPLATNIYVCFKQAAAHFCSRRTKITQYPIRFCASHTTLKKSVPAPNIAQTKKNILILGGSQGSIMLNKAIQHILSEQPQIAANICIIHQTGSLDNTNWQQFYKQLNIDATVFDYCPDMQPYYTKADLIICRAGAGTIFEVLFFEKPCILVPLEIPGNDHQVHNAHAIMRERPDLFKTVCQENLDDLGTVLHGLVCNSKLPNSYLSNQMYRQSQ